MNKKDLHTKIYHKLLELDFDTLSFHNNVIINSVLEEIRSLKTHLEELKKEEKKFWSQNFSQVDYSQSDEPPPLPNEFANVIPLKKVNEKKYKILVVDDDPDAHNIIKHALYGNESVDVTIERSPKIALEKIKNSTFDLLLIDIVMKEMTGWEFMAEIQKVEIKNEMDIVIGTYQANQHEKITALELGASDYLLKPYDLNELKFKLRLKYQRKLKHG